MFDSGLKKKCETLLVQGLSCMKIEVDAHLQAQMIAYLALLQKWNNAFNLTAVRDPLKMVGRHLLDSLAISPYLHGEHMIDVGTGAGLPGIPLSILHPEKSFFLLDSNQKKQIFLTQVVKSLSLKNVQCVHSLVEAYQPTEKFSTILTRAFASPAEMIHLTKHLLAEDGQFLAMMGKVPEDIQLPAGFEVKQIISLKIPGEEAERHLGIVTREKNHKE
ncbi:MAG: 16S rRNA (guanine(527)-N(7))-methyltransferase RsmG [Gammaproteobacteria bacterium 39-13]|nr:16S rRNA (guanine(527)-N(7))-methyltransferase RsmG [Gammaproteobacteria bacterium]OJV90705.1 MAG: 16S rRNA (guanine(527)-N(7))-methyltransferase RsmG [Gammaproteobacteria bacterium 39-13]